jgi:hypothetical protein
MVADPRAASVGRAYRIVALKVLLGGFGVDKYRAESSEGGCNPTAVFFVNCKNGRESSSRRRSGDDGDGLLVAPSS